MLVDGFHQRLHGGLVLFPVEMDHPLIVIGAEALVGGAMLRIVVDGRLKHLEVGGVDVVLVEGHGSQQGIAGILFPAVETAGVDAVYNAEGRVGP